MEKNKERIWFKRMMYALVAFLFCIFISRFDVNPGNPEFIVEIIVLVSGIYFVIIGLIYTGHRRRKIIKMLEDESKV